MTPIANIFGGHFNELPADLPPNSIYIVPGTTPRIFVYNTDRKPIEFISSSEQDLSTYQLKLSEGAFVDGDKTKLDGIATGAEVNTIDSDPTSDGVTGSDQITNIVSCTQAEYDAGTPDTDTVYIING